MAVRPKKSGGATFKSVEAYCLSLPGSSMVVQWGDNHVYKAGGKVFAIMGRDETGAAISVKVEAQSFLILTREKGITQAPYLAKGQWAMIRLNAIAKKELEVYIARSHALIATKLTKQARAALGL